MKRLISLFAISLALCTGFKSFADIPPILQVTDVHKEGGRHPLFGGETRYGERNGYSELDTIDRRGEKILLEHNYYYFTEPGSAKCRVGTAKYEDYLDYKGVKVDYRIIYQYENDLLEQIEMKIRKNEAFSGNLAKMVQVSYGSRDLWLVFRATWDNGNAAGDADIHIVMMDVTDYINQ